MEAERTRLELLREVAMEEEAMAKRKQKLEAAKKKGKAAGETYFRLCVACVNIASSMWVTVASAIVNILSDRSCILCDILPCIQVRCSSLSINA